MQFEYRYLSKEKIEEIDAKRYANMYGTLISIGSEECITSEDETIVFTYIGGHPGDEYPEESFLYYKGWYYYVYIYNEYGKAEKTENGKIWYDLSRIERISNATLDKDEKEAPKEQELLDILKQVLIEWKNNVHGRIGPNDKIITEVYFKGEQL